MIDKSSIRAEYQKMSNEQLMAFAMQDGDQLTPDGIKLLTDEFNTRHLDTNIISAIKDGTLSDFKAKVKDSENAVIQQLNMTYMSTALMDKRDNKSDDEIKQILIELGMHEDNASLIISQLATQAHRLYQKANQKIVNAIFLCAAAIALYLINPKDGSEGLLLNIVCSVSIIIGALMITKALFDKNKFATIIKNIKGQPEGLNKL